MAVAHLMTISTAQLSFILITGYEKPEYSWTVKKLNSNDQYRSLWKQKYSKVHLSVYILLYHDERILD